MVPEELDDDPLAFLARAETALVRGASRPVPESLGLVPEDQIDGRWIIKTCIGRGAFGVVFEAEHIGDPRDYVAIKVVAPDPGGDPRWIARFIQEADVTVQLRHPNIVRTREHGALPDGARFLVMELLEGETMADTIRAQRGLDWAMIAQLADELGAALGASHGAGILHRDVKPTNVFLAEVDAGAVQVKLLDFGLCKGPAAVTRSRERLGSLLYMAPEVVRSGSQTASAAADIYGMAMTIREAITGVPAFAAVEVPALLAEILRGPAQPPVSQLRADTPAGVDALLAAGLAREPKRRPGDATRYGRALAAAIRGQRIHS